MTMDSAGYGENNHTAENKHDISLLHFSALYWFLLIKLTPLQVSRWFLSQRTYFNEERGFLVTLELFQCGAIRGCLTSKAEGNSCNLETMEEILQMGFGAALIAACLKGELAELLKRSYFLGWGLTF